PRYLHSFPTRRSSDLFKSDDLHFSQSETDKAIIAFIENQQAELRNSYLLLADSDIGEQFGVVIIDGKYRGFGHFLYSELNKIQIESKLSKAPDSPAAKAVIRKMLNDDRIEKISL